MSSVTDSSSIRQRTAALICIQTCGAELTEGPEDGQKAQQDAKEGEVQADAGPVLQQGGQQGQQGHIV